MKRRAVHTADEVIFLFFWGLWGLRHNTVFRAWLQGRTLGYLATWRDHQGITTLSRNQPEAAGSSVLHWRSNRSAVWGSEAQLSLQATCAAPCWLTPMSCSQPTCMQGSATHGREHSLSTKCPAQLQCHTITGSQAAAENQRWAEQPFGIPPSSPALGNSTAWPQGPTQAYCCMVWGKNLT